MGVLFCADKNLTAYDALAIGEALKTNETVTIVDLHCKKMLPFYL